MTSDASGRQAIEVVDDRNWSRRAEAPRSAVDRDNHAGMQEAGAGG